MPMTLLLSPFLKTLPVYQPGRPIEEVAREMNLPADSIIKVASNENPFGPSPLAIAAMQKAIVGVNLYPDGNAFYLKQKLAAKLGIEKAALIRVRLPETISSHAALNSRAWSSVTTSKCI